jgi:Group II intron, maturase-specific domain/HNH endonuclease
MMAGSRSRAGSWGAFCIQSDDPFASSLFEKLMASPFKRSWGAMRSGSVRLTYERNRWIEPSSAGNGRSLSGCRKRRSKASPNLLKSSPQFHEKTQITHVEEGFDFLGQNVRRYRCGKVLTKPSSPNVKTFLTKIQETIDGSGSLTAGEMIRRLNQQIKGWTMYHRYAASKRTFRHVDHRIFEMLWRWCRRRRSRGGPDTADNLELLHANCHRQIHVQARLTKAAASCEGRL